MSTAAAGPIRQPSHPLGTRRGRRATVSFASASMAAVALLALLTGCDKPNPGVTVFSGTDSAHREAICWSADASEAVTGSDCSLTLDSADEQFREQLLEQVAVIPTAAGQTVGISVDPVVAANGWVVTINGRALTRDAITEKYFKFTMPPQALRRGDAQLVVQALTSGGDSVRGAWLFGLGEGTDD